MAISVGLPGLNQVEVVPMMAIQVNAGACVERNVQDNVEK